VYYPYYYGTNVIYRDRIVYVNDVEYVSSSEFYYQAQDLARSADIGTTTSESDDDWLPMGTFAVFEDDGEKDTGLVLQLAANNNGQILGNILDEANDTVWPVSGAVEMETQRVAFRLTDDDDLVYECGLWNLTQDTAPMLVHLGEDEQTNWTLIRLADNSAEEQQSSPPAMNAGGGTGQQPNSYRDIRRGTIRRAR
jgi:hypothetical protein